MHECLLVGRKCALWPYAMCNNCPAACVVVLPQECTMKVQEGKFKLQDLLVVPMQRVLKYHLLLKVGCISQHYFSGCSMCLERNMLITFRLLSINTHPCLKHKTRI